MADINQSLGLDAQQAIRELGKLAVSIDVANAAIGRMQSATAADPTGKVAAAAKEAQSSITSLNRTVGKFKGGVTEAGRAGARAGKDITASWELVGRVIGTQFLVRGLSEIIRQFADASDAAQEFQLTIARTAAIAGEGAGTSYAALGAEVRQLAIDLGRPIADVQSAAFQTLQNDIGDVTESFQFLREASDLSIATGSELETSVNSLTSILKSYGQEVSESARNADILFKTVDVGRVSLDELENRLGTITPQAAALDVAFEEAASAVASLTLSGLDTAKAATQLRNIFSKLIRPTTELQNAFERLGVSSGQELIQEFGGLQGALGALTEAFDGNETAVANAFGTIRGQLGVLNLLANEGSEFSRVLTEIRENSAGSLEAAVGEVNQTNARDFEREIAKVNDTLLQLGQTSLQIKTALAETFNTFIPNAQTALSVVAAFGAAATVAFNGYIIAATRAAFVTTAALGPLGILSATLAAVAAYDFANVATLESSFANIAKAASDTQRDVDAVNQASQRDTEKAFQDSLNRQKTDLEEFSKEAAKFYANIRSAAENQFQRIDLSTIRTIKEFTAARKELVEGLFEFIDSIDGRIKTSFAEVREAQQELDEFRFERSLRGLSEQQQVTALLTRSQQQLRQAREDAANAGFDQEKRAAAEALRADAQRTAAQALRQADSLNNIGLQQSAERQVTETIRARADLARQAGTALQNLDQNALKRSADEANRIRIDLEALTAELKVAQSRRDEQGRLRPQDPQSRREQAANVDRIQGEIAKLETELSNIELIDQAGLRDLFNKTGIALQQGIDQAQIDFSSALSNLRAQLAETAFDAQVRLEPLLDTSAVAAIREQLAAAVTGEDFQERVQQALDFRNTLVKEQNEARQRVNELNGALAVQRTRIREIGEEAVGLGRKTAVETLQDIFSGDQDTLADEAKSVKAARATGTELETLFLRVQNDGVSAVDAVEERARVLRGSLSSALSSDQVNVLREGFEVLDKAIQNAKDRAEAEGGINLSLFDTQRIQQEAEDISGRLKPVTKEFKKSNEEAGKGAGSVNQINQNLQNTQAAAQNSARKVTVLANELERAALAQTTLGAGAGGGGIQTVYKGGMIYKNIGGDLTRGQDQTLVAAARGETITNARSSQQFFAELRAINSGNAPVFREQGGPVTNIGDINVNVDARNAQSVDGRQIARQLNRELRRGSSNLRG